MDYFEIKINTTPSSDIITDVLSALAGEAGCESFIPETNGLTAYAQQNIFDKGILEENLSNFPIENVLISYEIKVAENKDWNAEWEQNSFQPIVIGNECVVHSMSHTDYPVAKYDIIINPKLAFGSGHHQTTSMMMQRILDMDIKGLDVLDMGCGTSILGILAKMCGANHLTAIDIDQWSVDNSKEHFILNNIDDAVVLLGDATLLTDMKFDVILANINRNILLNDMAKYVACLNPSGALLMSGFYTEDIPLIQQEAERLGLTYLDSMVQDNWACLKFKAK